MNTTSLLERPRWPPYLAGAGIGLLNVATLLGVGRMLGVTSPFESLAALASGKVAPKVMHVDAYQRERKTEPRLDWELRPSPKPMKTGGVVLGALTFGTGMAVSGYCPGTSLAALGAGRRDARATVLGMLGGAAAFVRLYPRLAPLS